MNWGALIYAITLVMIVLGLAMVLKADPTISIAAVILFYYYYDKFDKKKD